MLRYSILKKNDNSIKRFNIINHDTMDDGNTSYYLLECDTPHGLTNSSKINIDNSLNIPISIVDDKKFKIIKEDIKHPLNIVHSYYYDGKMVFRTNDINFNGNILIVRENNVDIELPTSDVFNEEDWKIYNLFEAKQSETSYWDTENAGEYVPEVNYIDTEVEYELITNKCNDDEIDFIITDTNINVDNIDVFFYIKNEQFDNVWVNDSNYSLLLPISNMVNNNLHREDYVNNILIKKVEEEVINDVTDNERIRFYPVRRLPNGDYEEIQNIKFECYFKYDNGDYTDSWSHLGIKNENIKYQHSKLKKTFLRLLYYDEQNPTSQSLYYYNTVFVDTNKMYRDYLRGFRIEEGEDTNFDIVFNVSDKNKINNKSNSSEGFFIYLFGANKPTAEPESMYMKMEFNSAIDGQKYLFFNRESTDGVDLNNIFFDLENSPNYIYYKILFVYSEELNKYVYYFDETNEGVEYDGNELILRFWEAKVK